MTKFNQTVAKLIQTFTLVLVSGMSLLAADQAKAILNINIFDDGPDLKISVSGSLSQLPVVADTGFCGVSGLLAGEFQTVLPGYNNLICSGPDTSFNLYNISGPSGFGGTQRLGGATSVSGSTFWFASSAYTSLFQYSERIGLDPGFLGGNYFSEAIFSGRSLASEGFTASGLVGSWTLDGTSESINVFLGPPTPPSTVPGPLPLLGAGAAYGCSRRLRRRIASTLITPHK